MGHGYKVDFHTHALDHKYFDRFSHIRNFKGELSNAERSLVQQAIQSGIDRNLDAMVISDHNQFTSGFYAHEYANRWKKNMRIIPGCECSVIYNHSEIHVLALGCKQAFEYDKDIHVSHVIRMIHDNGGLAVLAHPHNYLWETGDILHMFDGVEIYNGNVSTIQTCFGDYKVPTTFKGFTTRGSDYHFPNGLSDAHREGVKIVTQNDAVLYSLLKEWE